MVCIPSRRSCFTTARSFPSCGSATNSVYRPAAALSSKIAPGGPAGKNSRGKAYAPPPIAPAKAAKALGTGIRGFRLSEVEVLHDALGAPYFAFSGNAEALVQKRGLIVSLSITHTDALAAAMVTAQEKGDPTV